MANASTRFNRTKTKPIGVPRTTRTHDLRCLTSMPAGKMVPIAAVPLLREDSVTRMVSRLSFEMMETVEILMNAVNVNVKAYFVPFLAFERFNGMDDFNRSYEGLPFKEGDPVIPFIETETAEDLAPDSEDPDLEILRYMGKHFKMTSAINTAYIEAYNLVWNFRAANRSNDIEQRDRLDTTLAPAFWQHTQFDHIVPDVDLATLDGEVPLNLTGNGRMPVKGIGVSVSGNSVTSAGIRETEGDSATSVDQFRTQTSGGTYDNSFRMRAVDIGGTMYPDVWAELEDSGVTVSLSNLELARKTQAFARLREQYTGHTDEYIIDLLMDGISVPEQAWKQPMLLADRSTIFGMSKRYASDSGNLTESVVSGATFIDLVMSMPRVPTGGIIMIFAEATPEQLFERQKDHFLHLDSVDKLPQYLRDELDPEKVEAVPNNYIDVDHDTPDSTFGYAPLNHAWTSHPPQIGGRFYRPEVDAGFDEDRQRIWAVETQNPTLSEDFYLCTTMHTKPFVVTNQDPFECVLRGAAIIRGNTVFGPVLIENNNSYEEVFGEAPLERIVKEE